MKNDNGRQSVAQKEFQAAVEKSGYGYEVARSIDEFMRITTEHLRTAHIEGIKRAPV